MRLKKKLKVIKLHLKGCCFIFLSSLYSVQCTLQATLLSVCTNQLIVSAANISIEGYYWSRCRKILEVYFILTTKVIFYKKIQEHEAGVIPSSFYKVAGSNVTFTNTNITH